MLNKILSTINNHTEYITVAIAFIGMVITQNVHFLYSMLLIHLVLRNKIGG